MSGLLTYWTGVVPPGSQRSEDKTQRLEAYRQEVLVWGRVPEGQANYFLNIYYYLEEGPWEVVER